MEMEGRGFSELYRNSSEELFFKSLMESSIGMPVPPMEMLGFKNPSQNLRTDSEELFKSWLTNGETNGYASSSIAHRTRQASRRISTELGNGPNQQQGISIQRKRSNDVLSVQNTTIVEDIPSTIVEVISSDTNHQSMRNSAERNTQASNLYLAKAWFQSSQPMTRSRSSELRKRYVAMQSSQTLDMEALQNVSEVGIDNLKQELPNLTVSSVVNMLKGTLERKKLGNQVAKEMVEDSSAAIYHPLNSGFEEVKANNIYEIPGAFQQVSPGEVEDPRFLQRIWKPIDIELEGFVNSANPFRLNAISREPSQSESSAAAPVVSSGFDVCDGPNNCSQTLNAVESSRKAVGNTTSESGSKAKDFRESIIDNLKEERKRGGLVRYGSMKSTNSVEKGDPTKKRRVERFRKMAEAKERSLTPAIPSDMQSVLKRSENLEKEVRSLKLNLSFMNRKDSEQTKQIEELQKKNDDLTDEKERLLEVIERILSETGKV